MIRSKGFNNAMPLMYLFTNDERLKVHPSYKLANYIQVYGGIVKGVVVLVNAGRNPQLVPKAKFVQLIKERFDDEFTEVFGIEPGALTANEAQYLAGFRSLDAIRNRLVAAEQEIDRRLRSKGITRTP
jgi:hypothetical protein